MVHFRFLETLRDYGREKIVGTGTGTSSWRSTRQPDGSVPGNSS